MKPLNECRVLLVDDAKTNIDILVEGLKDEYKLSVALSGEAALKLAEKNPPDLILLDIVMPGLDGYEVCRRLRANTALADVPIVFLSSLDEIKDKARGFEAGANDYITKPFDILEVKVRSRSLLKAKAYSDAVKEQMAGELRVAHNIQMGMIPTDFSRYDEEFGVEIAAVLEPAREVGGDLYGVFAPGADRLVVVMGDVAGKGIPASLFMVRASTLARTLSREIAEPERIVSRLNDELSEDNPSVMFVTLACAVFDPATRRLSMANGGHPRSVLLREGEAPRWALLQYGIALGLEPSLPFERTELDLVPGDIVVFYTDGVTEAFDPQSALYGSPRLLADLAATPRNTAAGVVSGLLAHVKRFANGAPQSDDIAILALRVLPPPESVRLELSPTAGEVVLAVERLARFARRHGAPEADVHALTLSLEEIASNIVNHACRQREGFAFGLEFRREGDSIAVEVFDPGPPFDPLAQAEPNLDEDPCDRRAGGLGILLVRRYMTSLEYRREGEWNVLRMVRKLSVSPSSPD